MPKNAQGVPVEQIVSERYSGIEMPRRLVIRDAEAWNEVWAEITRNRRPRPAAPTIDFSRDFLILAAMGTRGTGGYSISIDSVSGDERGIYVVVREVSPGAACMLIQAFSTPLAIVRVQQSDKPIKFVERKETLDCP